MITPADSPGAPELYNAVPVSQVNILAPQQDLSGMVAAATALANGPRQAQTEMLLSSPQGFAGQGYDIDAGYSGNWPNDVEPTVAGP